MPLSSDLLDHLGDGIRQMLQDSGTLHCSVHVENVQNTIQHRTFYNNGEEGSVDSDSIETTIYGIGSLTKSLVALLMCIIIDKLSLSPHQDHQRYAAIRKLPDDPWNTSFTKLFNTFSDAKIEPLQGDPTVLHILLHCNSIPPMNHTLLSPCGSPLLSKESFLRVAATIAQAAYGNATENQIAYSSGNYILIAILIEAIAGKPLESVMKEHLLIPLGMSRTCLGAPGSRYTDIALPYTLSASGNRVPVDPHLYPAGNIVNAALGGYSCTRDFAIFLRTIYACINGNHPILEQDSIRRFVARQGVLNDGTTDTFSLCGLCITLDSTMAGSRSINRLVSPDNICSTYRLGRTPEGTQVSAYYFAGHTQGYSSCFYLMPQWHCFVIVLTNTTSRTDSSDHISRFILQEMFDLKLTQSSLLPSFMTSYRMNSCAEQIDVVAMSSLAAVEGQKMLEKFAIEDSQEDAPNLCPILLEGTYFNSLTEQSIVISRPQGTYEVNISGSVPAPMAMGLIRTGERTIRLRPLSALGFTIDRYDPFGWKELNFALIAEADHNNNQNVVRLERQGHPLGYIFTRLI